MSALFLSPAAQEQPARTGRRSSAKVDRRKVAKFTELALALPDVRARRVAELKARITAGNYQIGSLDLAEKMLDE